MSAERSSHNSSTSYSNEDDAEEDIPYVDDDELADEVLAAQERLAKLKLS